MSGNDMERQLRDAAGLGPGGPRAATSDDVAGLVKRARRKTHVWAAVALMLWAAVGLGFFYIVYGYFMYFHPIIVLSIEEGPGARLPEAMRVLPYAAMYVTAAWAGLIVAAACATVVFVYLAGKSTLRQINMSLADIAARMARST